MTHVAAEPGSFRDRRGRIFYVGDRVFRTVAPIAAEDFEFVRSTGLIELLSRDGVLVGENRRDTSVLGAQGAGASFVLEHPRIPFISYPYEWPFQALKAAALLQLDILLAALERGVALTDASAYNIQFIGVKPIFIDNLSFCRYVDGEFWLGHRQFCEQFINPLLLCAKLGVPYNAWYRGNLEGITAEDLAAVLPWRSRLSWNVFTNVYLQARLQSTADRSDRTIEKVTSRRLPRVGFEQILVGLRRWVAKLQPRSSSNTVWRNYAADNSYSKPEEASKRQMIADFTKSAEPELILDIGCNTGEYSRVALENGAKLAIGFDFDVGALDVAFERAQRESLAFLPLSLDAANPSPDQGWAQSERKGFQDRAKGDAVLALALIHHLAIAKNVPLDRVVSWLVNMAPRGVLEFVPKSDPMVERLLLLREDLFDDYDQKSFEAALSRRARIVRSQRVSSSGRTLYCFERT